ncbi:T9SS type A sorting domain-containing protein [Phaeocystidibacter marisrubri]|uniref:T9SS type A sorting domain-containing protein n=2 Tax=Phaeocystidibacter marisrubri TaxID=1577780 RepID=A0A6L3ZJG2_9FLAO|nr:T9SS type A sorting domain-containing protein [Phaeocystidibacter marisrubri]
MFRLAQTMKKYYAVLLSGLLAIPAFGQVHVESSTFSISRQNDFVPREVEPGFNANIYSLEAPDAMSWRAQLNEVKRAAAEAYPAAETTPVEQFKNVPTPGIEWTSKMYRVFTTIGTTGPLYGGIPNDNTLAFSKDGIMLAAVNSMLWAYDTKNDTVHIVNSFIGLDAVGPDAGNDRGFDPKLMYDEEADRFVLVFLKNNTAATSKIAVCFSSTNDPNDPWYTYILPGNPLNNNRWTDFPAISMTEDHLFITGNLIIPNVSWQVGFDGSIIWQLDKQAGFNGDTVMPNRLYHDIKFGTKYIRNLHPVKGYNGDIDTAFFLSNRNFDMQNDSIFILSVRSDITGTEDLSIDVAKSDINYGVPPNGQQQDTDPNDPTDGLQTNDGRVLGAIQMSDGSIQFVSNTRNFTTGRSSIYHGTIVDPAGQPSITAQLISDPQLDFGYPNIAWSGNEECDHEVIIGFNHTSATDFAGVSAVYYSNDGQYSDVLRIKEGEGVVKRLAGGDRWGDYFGIQHDFAHPGNVYVAGFYGTSDNSNSAFFAQLTSPDSSKLSVNLVHTSSPQKCNQYLDAQVSGGVQPYSYWWNGVAGNNTYTSCGMDTIQLMVSDARGCETTLDYVVPFNIPNNTMTYPNPTTGFIGVVFNAQNAGEVVVQLSDMTGKQVWVVTEQAISTGKHYLEFDLAPVASGVYILNILQGDESIYTERIIKN